MSTVQQIKKERESFDGRAHYKAFQAYCGKTSTEPTAENLTTWDVVHNFSQIKESFGSKDDIYKFGLKERYARFLLIYCLKIPNGEVVVGSGRQSVVHSWRKAGGERVFLSDVTARQVNLIRDELKAKLRQLIQTQKFFNLGAATIRAMVDEVLDEVAKAA